MKLIKSYKQISTKKGDKGTSTNYSNEEFSKSDVLFDTLGTIDELSSMLGVVYHYTKLQDEIRYIQTKLQDINSLVATTNEEIKAKLIGVSIKDIEKLEEFEKRILEDCSIEPVFVLPGSDSTKESAYFDLSRSIARRAERRLVSFVNYYQRDDLIDSMRFLNRLSDLLFIIARSL